MYFFDGVYGTLTGSGDNMHNENALVYWTTDPNDTTVGNLPIIQIKINGEDIYTNTVSGGVRPLPHTLHTPLTDLKVGDIILTNFAFDQYIDTSNTEYANPLYPGMFDSLTCRQPAMGRVIQAADTSNDTPCIVDFKPSKPNVGHGLKLITTDTYSATPEDTMVGLDLMTERPMMNGDISIYVNPANISGINALDKTGMSNRHTRANTHDKHLYTVYPTGKSNDLLDRYDNEIALDSAFIMPNFSLCVIPGYEFTQHPMERPIVNWNGSSPMGNDSYSLEHGSWSMIGVNLAKTMWGGSHATHPWDTVANARNISGLRVNTDEDELHESWFGFGNDTESELYYKQSGGLSVNVGSFLGIGSEEELANTTPVDQRYYYNEGKVNVRVNKMQGLYDSGANKLAVNIAGGYSYAPEGVTHNWLEGGLTFVDGGTRAPAHGVLAVNTAEEASGLGIKNSYRVNVRHTNWNNRVTADTFNNVLVVKPAKFTESSAERAPLTMSGLEVHRQIQE